MFFSECREIALVKNMQSNVDYRKLMKESGNLMDSILNKLDKDSKSLVFQLEEIQNQKAGMDIHSVYYQGIADCIALLKY